MVSRIVVDRVGSISNLYWRTHTRRLNAIISRRGAGGSSEETLGGEEMLTEQQKVGAALGYDVQAEQALLRRQRQRVAQFQGGGQFTATTGATSYSRETGLGTAQ